MPRFGFGLRRLSCVLLGAAALSACSDDSGRDTTGATGGSGGATPGIGGKGGGSAGQSSAGRGGDAPGGDSATCAPPSSPLDERCSCPPCPDWRAVPLPTQDSYDTLFVTRNGRVFVSRDELFYSDTLDGTWTATGVEATLLHEDGEGRLLARLNTALALSEDGGVTWAPLASAPSPREAWLAPQGIYSGALQLKRTTDNGKTWSTFANHQQGISALADGTLFGRRIYYHPGQNRWIDLRPAREDLEEFSPLSFATNSGAVLRGGAKGVIVSKDFGESWQSVWSMKPDALAANTSSLVTALFEQTGVYVYRSSGWAQIGPAKTGVFLGHGVLPDGRVLVLGSNKGQLEPILAGPRVLAVTTAPVAGDPVMGPAYPATCTDGMVSGTEEAIDCGGGCAPCKNWHVLPQAPDARRFVLLPSGTLLGLTNLTISRSTDSGLTWSMPDGRYQPYSLAAAPDGTVYMTSGSGDTFYVSTDDALTFEQIGPDPIPVSAWDLLVTKSGAIIAHNQGNVGRSLDGGLTWQRPMNLPDADNPFVLSTGELFLSSTFFLFRSTDDGDTWETLDPPFDEALFSALDGTTILARSGTVLHISKDSGTTWQEVKRPEPDVEYSRFLTEQNGGYLYAGTKVYLSDDAVTWREVDDSGRYEALPLLQLPNGSFLGTGKFDQMARLTRPLADW
jgi:hypothetical protein